MSLLTCLCSAIPARERVITCEEVFELRVPLPDVVAMQTRQPNLEGAGEIALRRLVKEALRMRPSRIVVGDVRQEECLDLTHYGSTHTGRAHFRACNEGSRSQPNPGSHCSSRPGGPTVCGDGQPDEVLSVAVAEPVAGVVITGALTTVLVISPVLVVVSTAVVGGRQLPTRADQVPSSPDA
jgi:hypothetical protein